MKQTIFFLFFLISSLVLAQVVDVEDIKNKLHNLNGKEQLSPLNDISRFYYDRNWDSVSYYAQKLYDLSNTFEDKTGQIQALNHLGRAQSANADFEKSKDYFEKALKIASSDLEQYIDTYEGLGLTYLYWNKVDSAEIYFDRSIALAEDFKKPKRAKSIALNKGVIAISNAFYKDAIEIFLKDYEFFQDENDYTSLFIINNGVGNAYFHQLDLPNAKKYYNKALQISLLADNPVNTGKSYGNIANTYGNIGEFDSAAIYFAKSYKYFEDAGDIDRANLVRVNLLNLYVLTDESEKLLKLCNELENESLSPEHRIILLHSKSRGLYKLNRYKESTKALQNAITIAEGLDSEHSLLKLYTTSLNQYLGINNPTLLNHFDKYDSILNSRFDRDNKEIMSELNTKYEVKEKETQLVEAELNNQKQKTFLYAATGGILGILLLAGGRLAYIQQRQRKLEFQKEIELSSLEKNMAKLSLSNLNNQIDSHDFKNTLTTVLNEVQEKAPESYDRLVGLLRITESALYNDAFTESLENQLLQAEGLVSIANYQLFEDINLEIENELDNSIQLPRLLLKNLVENSIKHGIKGTNREGKIQIVAQKKGAYYQISVIDNGKGLNGDPTGGLGISVYRDLFAYFNKKNVSEASLAFRNLPEGVEATIRIPVNYKYT